MVNLPPWRWWWWWFFESFRFVRGHGFRQRRDPFAANPFPMQAKARCRECNPLPGGAEVDGIAVRARAGMNSNDSTFPPAGSVESVDAIIDLERRKVRRLSGANRADKEEIDVLPEELFRIILLCEFVEFDKDIAGPLGRGFEDSTGVPRTPEIQIVEAHFHFQAFLEASIFR